MISVVFILNLGSEVIPDVAHVGDVVLHHQGHVGRHGERDLAGQTARLGEHLEIPGGEGQVDGLLHLDGDGLLLLVHVGGLGELDVADSDISGCGELDALLGAGDDHGLPELSQITDLGGDVKILPGETTVWLNLPLGQTRRWAS